MPTLSQCQILTNLLERQKVPNEDPSAESGDAEGAQAEKGRPIALVGYPRTTTPQPTHNEYRYTPENIRPVSVGGKLETAGLPEADHDVTAFQKQRMQMVEKAAQILPAWRPRGLWTKDVVSRWRAASSPFLNQQSKIYRRQTTYVNFFADETNAAAFHPRRYSAGQRCLPIKISLENLIPSEIGAEGNQVPVPIQTVIEKSALKASDSSKQLAVPGPGNAGSSKPSVRFSGVDPQTESETGKDGETYTAEGEKTEDENPVVKTPTYVNCPDNVKEQLYQLGWRKPEKKKKKIKKKHEEKTRNAKLTYMQMPKLDLMKDPMLRKLSKKSKNVMVQAHPPEMRPKAVCFNIVGAHLTHLLVWKSFQRDVLSEYDEVKVESIQFVPRSIFVPRTKNADPVENRWVITLTNEWYRSRVTGMDIRFGEFTTQLRRYDDVVSLEYRQYTRMTDMMKMIKPKR